MLGRFIVWFGGVLPSPYGRTINNDTPRESAMSASSSEGDGGGDQGAAIA